MSNKYNVAERFMRYVQIDTTSDPTSSTFPSTAKQRDLALILFEELKKLGLQEVEIDEWSYVFATIPSNVSHEANRTEVLDAVDAFFKVANRHLKLIPSFCFGAVLINLLVGDKVRAYIL